MKLNTYIAIPIRVAVCPALSVHAKTKKDSAVRLRICAWHDAARPAIPASGFRHADEGRRDARMIDVS